MMEFDPEKVRAAVEKLQNRRETKLEAAVSDLLWAIFKDMEANAGVPGYGWKEAQHLASVLLENEFLTLEL